MATLYKDMVRVMRRYGCERVAGGTGSHEKWHSPITNINASVPRSSKSRHTFNNLLKQMGIDERL